jgi:hypothetical protein
VKTTWGGCTWPPSLGRKTFQQLGTGYFCLAGFYDHQVHLGNFGVGGKGGIV